jgi:HEAT repeat protein
MRYAIVVLAACLAIHGTAAAQEPGPGPQADLEQAEIEATWQTACEWAVGSARNRVLEARKKMVELGEPALRFVVSRLGTQASLELEAVNAVITGFGAAAAAPVAEAAEKETADAPVRAALHLLGVLRSKGALEGDALSRASTVILTRTAAESLPIRLRALLVASEFGLREALPCASELANHEKETVRRGIAMILGKFGGAEVVGPLIGMLRDRLMTVRFPAQDALGLAGPEAVPPLLEALRAEKEVIPLNHMLMALGALAPDEAPAALDSYLKNENPLVRGFALRGMTNFIEARRARWEKLPDGDDKGAALEVLKAAASRLRSSGTGDGHAFVQAQRAQLEKAADVVMALAYEGGKK